LQIDISITIHVQGGTKYAKEKKKNKNEKSLLRKDIVPLMLNNNATNVQ
jgi:hypothetical protein